MTMMNELLRAFYHRYVEAANARDYDAIAELLHDKVTVGGNLYKRDDVLASLKGIVDAVPDFTWHLEALVIEEDRIAARLRDTGTPTKTFLGVPPTGASVEISEFASYRVRDGRFEEMWFLIDQPTLASQLAAAE